MKTNLWLAAFLLMLLPAWCSADDWPQFRGPNRDGVSRETGLRKDWPAGGPALLWTYDKLGVGYSGPAVVGDRIYIGAGRGDSDFLVALDMKGASPQEVWATRIGPLFQWKGNTWNRGPNATPTVTKDSHMVYALGGFGDLVCVEAGEGKERWRKNLPRDLGGEVNPQGGGLEDPTPLGWGYSSAPLVDGDRLICVPGGKRGLLAALDKNKGTLIWQSKEVPEQASYSSPIAIEVGGTKQYVQVVSAGMVGVGREDGKRLWSYQRTPPYDDVVIATPVFSDNYLFATVGFQQGCDLIKLTQGNGAVTADKIFSNKSIENRDGGVVLVAGHLYGHSENVGWFCQEFKTGKILWSERTKLGRGSVMFADGNLYWCAEKGGTVALVEASPSGWNEKGRFTLPRESKLHLPSSGLWTHPVIANGRLYIRDQELLFCYDLRK